MTGVVRGWAANSLREDDGCPRERRAPRRGATPGIALALRMGPHAEPGVSPAGGGAEKRLGVPRHAESVHRRRAAADSQGAAAAVAGQWAVGSAGRGCDGTSGGGCGE